MVSGFIIIHFDLLPIKFSQGISLGEFLVDHPSLEIKLEKEVELEIYGIDEKPWTLKFDGSSTESAVGLGILITSTGGV